MSIGNYLRSLRQHLSMPSRRYYLVSMTAQIIPQVFHCADFFGFVIPAQAGIQLNQGAGSPLSRRRLINQHLLSLEFRPLVITNSWIV
jgi:hypothetical protein